MRFKFRPKPVYYKFNAIINEDSTLYARKHSSNLNGVKKLILTDACFLFRVGLCFKINKLSK